MTDHITAVAQRAVEMEEYLKEHAANQSTADLVRTYIRLRDQAELLKKQVKRINEVVAKMKEHRIPERFAAEDINTINVELDGSSYRVSGQTQLRCTIIGGQKEAAFKWLRNNDLEDLIQDTVNSSSLAAFARSWAAENRELPDDIFRVYTAPNTLVTKV